MTAFTERVGVLLSYGFTIGQRDPRINSNYPGQFMVVEPYEESQLPTQDGRNGPWCVVGDNLSTLVCQGFEYLQSML